MSRKQNRKRARRQRARAGSSLDFILPPPGVDPWAPPPELESVEDDDMLMAFFTGRRPAGMKTCGNCREFIEDGEFGRGTCLHPGSGVFAPWDTTAACDFFAARRR